MVKPNSRSVGEEIKINLTLKELNKENDKLQVDFKLLLVDNQKM